MQYIAPGLIMMSVITQSYANVVSSFFGAKFGKHIEELLVSPLPNWLIIAGYVTGGVMRGLMVGAVVTIVSVLFAHLQVASPLHDHRGRAAHLDRVLARRPHQRGAREELRSGELGAGVRADAAHVLRRRVLHRCRCCPSGRRRCRTQTRFSTWSTRSGTASSARSDVDVGLAFTIMIVAALVLFGAALTMLNKGMGIRE